MIANLLFTYRDSVLEKKASEAECLFLYNLFYTRLRVFMSTHIRDMNYKYNMRQKDNYTE